VLFKVGIFLIMCGIGIPILEGHHFVLWSQREKDALAQYRIHKAEGKPLTQEMKSAHFDLMLLYVDAALVMLGMTLISYWILGRDI
jgi:hypothetical protein